MTLLLLLIPKVGDSGAAASALRFNSSLNGLSVSGPFFADRLAVDFEEEPATRFRGFVSRAARVGLPYEA